MRHEESTIQTACVRWFRYAHRDLARLLFAVPNGGARTATTARILKAEGVVAGVADLLLLTPRGGYSALAVEMKTVKGRQSDHQRAWQQAAEQLGGVKYVICRSVDDFITAVSDYLNPPHQ